jgi:hypothetical protein
MHCLSVERWRGGEAYWYGIVYGQYFYYAGNVIVYVGNRE